MLINCSNWWAFFFGVGGGGGGGATEMKHVRFHTGYAYTQFVIVQ